MNNIGPEVLQNLELFGHNILDEKAQFDRDKYWKSYRRDYEGSDPSSPRINKYFNDPDKTEWANHECSKYENIVKFNKTTQSFGPSPAENESENEKQCKKLLYDYCTGEKSAAGSYPC